MKTKTIPAIIMLTAGFVACIAGIIGHMETIKFTKMLFIVLILFYILGSVIKIVIDSNFKEVQKEETTDGEAFEEGDSEEAGEETMEEKVEE